MSAPSLDRRRSPTSRSTSPRTRRRWPDPEPARWCASRAWSATTTTAGRVLELDYEGHPSAEECCAGRRRDRRRSGRARGRRVAPGRPAARSATSRWSPRSSRRTGRRVRGLRAAGRRGQGAAADLEAPGLRRRHRRVGQQPELAGSRCRLGTATCGRPRPPSSRCSPSPSGAARSGVPPGWRRAPGGSARQRNARSAAGVDRRQQQAAEQPDVLEEVGELRRPVGRACPESRTRARRSWSAPASRPAPPLPGRAQRVNSSAPAAAWTAPLTWTNVLVSGGSAGCMFDERRRRPCR